MSQIYTVEFHNQGNIQTVEVPEDKQILQAALDAGIKLPNSCNAGVCTTCAAKIIEGKVDQTEGMGLSPNLQTEGYVLLCIAYPRSNLKLTPGKEEEVYDRQFGRGS
ncbi:MAG TPA: 2Fe-2S iron-sulfur cluster-binding protein [Candidatus Obscuribacterales bacterium]